MRTFVFMLALSLSTLAFGQSKTTEQLQEKYNASKSLFFYNNTLRMLNQTEDKAYDELIKDIEKMKFLMIDKPSSFTKADYNKIVSDYRSEAFEEIMTSRYQGKNLNVYLKESGGKTKGMVVLVNDSSSLYVLDIVGSIALNKVTSLYKAFGESPDIQTQIDKFVHEHDSDSKNKKSGKDDHE